MKKIALLQRERRMMTSLLIRKFRVGFSGICGIFFLICFLIFSFFFKTRDDVRIIPLDFSVFSDTPLINIRIGSAKVPLLADTGSYQDLSLHTSVLNSIPDKEYIKLSSLKDPKGDVYETKEFMIPSIRIQSHTYEKILTYEQTPEQTAYAGLLFGSSKRIGPIQGAIGRPFFSKWTCFFDCSNRRLLLAPTMDSLAKHVDLRTFTPIPFELHPQGIHLSLSTDLGIKRFILDTGASLSVMKIGLVQEELREETGHPLKKYTTSTLSFQEKELGPWSFRLHELCSEMVSDGILGIDFFLAHRVVIDFAHSMVYVSSEKKPRHRITLFPFLRG